MFPIARDPTIIVLIGIIIGLTFFTVQMINTDSNNPYNITKFINKSLSKDYTLNIPDNMPSITDLTVLPEKSVIYENSTKIVTQWTEIPGEDYEDCTKYESGWGGSGPNSSSWGRCHNCNCISVNEVDI